MQLCSLNSKLILVTENNKVKGHWNDPRQFIINLWNKTLFYSFMQSTDPLYTTTIQAYSAVSPINTKMRWLQRWTSIKWQVLCPSELCESAKILSKKYNWMNIQETKWNNLIWTGKREKDTPGPTFFRPGHLNKVQRYKEAKAQSVYSWKQHPQTKPSASKITRLGRRSATRDPPRIQPIR
jgi:hypothetical protein